MSRNFNKDNEITLEEIKILQMDVLSAIDEFCHENGIRYSMACGTLLGAIRHGGYIPWDDDIDIYIPREDYKKLIAEFPNTYKGKIKLASLERDSEWEHPYAKAYDDRTILLEKANTKDVIGVNIDVYPIDEVPDNDKDWFRYDKKRRILQTMFALKFVKTSRSRSLLRNIGVILAHVFTVFLSTRKFAYKLDDFSQKNNSKGYGRYFECCQGLLQKRPFSKNLFNSLVYIPFEDRLFMAFKDADKYLTNGYGNYMQLPPEEQRVTHHSFKAYWK